MRILKALLILGLYIQQPPAGPQVPGIVEGVVINAVTGAPLKDAAVKAGSGRASVTAITGSDGTFVLQGVPPGSQTVRAELQGFAYAGSMDGPFRSLGPWVSVGSGQRLQNLELRLTPTLTISGRVTHENGQPAISIPVVLFQKGFRYDGSPGLYRLTTKTPTTDNRGEYRIPEVLPGEYYISASTDGFQIYYPGVRPASEAGRVVVTDSELVGIDFSLPNSKGYSVRFRLSGFSPMPGEFTVSLWPRMPALDAMAPTRTVRSAANGDLTLAQVLPGSYNMVVQWNDPASPGSVATKGAQTFPLDIVDRDVDLGTIMLMPRTTLDGRVTFAGGSPIRLNINMRAVGEGPVERSLSSNVELGSNNRFSIRNVPAGGYWLFTSTLPDVLYLSAVSFNGRDVLGRELSIGGTESGTVEVVIDGPPGAVSGMVRNAKGDPVGDATVVLLPAADRRGGVPQTSISDQTGSFSISRVPPGEYGLLAWETTPAFASRNAEWLKPYESQAVRVTVQKGNTATANLRVIP